MKNVIKTLFAAILVTFCFAFTAFADEVEPVVKIDSIRAESDGTLTVEFSTTAKYNIVELRILSGSHSKGDFDKASVISGGRAGGLQAGKYTVFAKDSEGNIGAYPFTATYSSNAESSSARDEDSYEESSSYEYGGSWIEYSSACADCDTMPETTPDRPHKEPTTGPDPKESTPVPETTPTPEPTTPAPNPTGPSPEESTPVEKLPQTGGFDGRMVTVIAVVLVAIMAGSGLIYLHRKENR